MVRDTNVESNSVIGIDAVPFALPVTDLRPFEMPRPESQPKAG